MTSEDIAKHLNDAVIEDAEAFRRKKETAILVMMFIDMVHSTAFREEMGEIQFEKLLYQKKNELTSIIERENKGKVIKDIGDGLLGVFAVPDLAVRNALEIQESLTDHAIFKVRIGLDMGQVTRETEQGIVKDVFGRHVNRAARLEALSEGGHILVSYPVWDSAKGWLKHLKHICWKKHGSYWLKGIAEPQVVYEPYDTRVTKSLKTIHGKKVKPDEELTYCALCGRYVKLKETFTCRACGTAEICIEYCYDSQQRQCIECASEILPTDHETFPETKPQDALAMTPSTQPGFDVFFMYSQQDKPFVAHLAEYMTYEGLNVWVDEEQIDIGDNIIEKIEQGLHRSKFLIVCLSKHFNDSVWCRSECVSLLIRETKAQNTRVLPIVVGDYEEADIPDFLYDKYSVDVRMKQGLERLMRKLTPLARKAVLQPETGAEGAGFPQELQAGLNELQSTLLLFSKRDEFPDNMIVEFDKIGLKLLRLLEHFPVYFDECYEVIAEYQHIAEKILHTLRDQEYRRVLLFRFRKVESCIEDLAGGFNCGDSFLGKDVSSSPTDSLYSFHALGEVKIDQHVNKLLSSDELDESEGIDWLFRSGFAKAESHLRKISEMNLLDDVLNALWKRFPRIFLHYGRDTFWGLVKYMLIYDNIRWKLRFYALKTLLKRSLTANQASEMLENFIPSEQHILGAFLALHPKRECREMALNLLPNDDRWDVVLCPKVPWLIIREFVEKSCQDSPDSYIKALFLLLRPRILTVNSPLAIGEVYTILKVFYHKPLFLQETFFRALTELHKELSSKAQSHPITKSLEPEFRQSFEAFCSKGMLKDVDVTTMTHIPLPIQRKLAHDGYLPKYFICNIRDVIALETVPYVEKRPDVVKFFRLRRINPRALEKLASNKLIMREYQNRSAFCRNPKANSVLIRSYLSSLTRREIQEISRDRNVNAYARELALKYLTRYN